MLYWLLAAVVLLLSRSWGLELVMPKPINADLFYQLFDITGSAAILFATKAAGHGRALKQRIVVDFMLAFMWADIFDRAIGITTFQKRDLLILPIWAVFTGLALYKQRSNIFIK